MSQLDFKLGPKIKAFRRQIGMQANKLASQLEISPSYLALIEGGKRKIDGDLLIKICDELKINISDLTSKSDVNMINTISELLDDQLFEDLDILGPEVKDLASSNPKIGKALIRLGDILKKTDILCLPSYREGLPKALIEGASFGLPIVTTDTVGCRDVVQDGVNGFLVPVKNIEELSNKWLNEESDKLPSPYVSP